MNNKELTELKKFIDGRIEFLFDHWVEHDKPPYTFGGWREEVVNDIANKLTSSNDEIKREAVERFVRALLLQCWTEDYVNDGRWKENNLDNAIDMGSQDFNAFVEEYLSHLTQKENNE